MSKPWPRVKLGEVLSLDLDKVAIDPSQRYPMVGVLSFGRGLFDREPIDNGNTSYKYFLRLKRDHFVMSQLFGWEGALAVSGKQFSGKFVSPQFPTFLCDKKKLELGFLGWCARRKIFWDELGTRTNGMGDRRRTLNPAALFESEVPLPPIEEQRRIVERFDAIRQHLQQADALRESITQEWAALCRSMIAHDPDTKRVAVADVVRQRAPDVLVEPDVSYPFAGVYSFGKGVFKGHVKQGAEFAYPKLSRLKTGDFIYPKLMAWEGALGVVPPECDGCVVSPEFPVFEIDEDQVLPEVFDVYFRDPQTWQNLQGGSTGTNARRRRLNPVDFLQLEVPVPGKETQRRLKDVRRLETRLMAIQADTTRGALFASVLNKLLT
jgi:type I restriction enzyme S subunit